LILVGVGAHKATLVYSRLVLLSGKKRLFQQE
jgi:hypothetical protein